MLLYDLGIHLYRMGIRLAGKAGNRKAALLDSGMKNTFPLLKSSAVSKTDGNIWIHAASLGEFEQGRPLIEALRRNHPEKKIILSFFSPSGYEVRKNYAGADVVCYLPADTPGNVRKFLDIVNPEIAIFVKYEFWLNYLAELRRRGIRTYLISGIFRRDQLFFKPWGSFYRKALKAFTEIYVQNEESQRLLNTIGITDVKVAGDTRFDRVTDIMRCVHPIPILDKFCQSARAVQSDKAGSSDHPLIFMVGSSWPEDEKIYADWLRKATSDDSLNIKGVIAPHEFDKSRLQRLLDFFGDTAILLSEAEKDPDRIANSRILIIDCFGLLASAYSYADVAFVGGGFGAGLHNINEAAVYGVPVFYGPNNHKFIEAQEMKSIGGGLEVISKEDFEEKIRRLCSSPQEIKSLGQRSAAYIKSKLGATDIIYKDIFG